MTEEQKELLRAARESLRAAGRWRYRHQLVASNLM